MPGLFGQAQPVSARDVTATVAGDNESRGIYCAVWDFALQRLLPTCRLMYSGLPP